MSAALILFIFAVTSGGSAAGWGSALVIAPLIISILMVIGFFYYETKIPAEVAAVCVGLVFFRRMLNVVLICMFVHRPPATWFLPNFSVLFGIALFPYLWWNTIFTLITDVWQTIYHWSAISVALRMLVLCIIVSYLLPC